MITLCAGPEIEDSAPQQSSARLCVNPPIIGRPTPFIGKEESVRNLTVSYSLHSFGLGDRSSAHMLGAGAPSMCPSNFASLLLRTVQSLKWSFPEPFPVSCSRGGRSRPASLRDMKDLHTNRKMSR